MKFKRAVKDKGLFWTAIHVLRHGWDRFVNILEEWKSRLGECKRLICNERAGKSEKSRTITFGEYKKIKKEDPYYKGRWRYFKQVVNIVEEETPDKVLELGPRRLPIVRGSDTMDVYMQGIKRTYVHNAAKIPWPVGDLKYDLFIALQVWEHLAGNQKEAFNEVMRISKAAILSFPYKQYAPGDCHHSIDERKIAEWTLHTAPKKVIRTGSVIVYFFKFI